MISLDFLQFDQMNLWFAIFSGAGLVRERKLLPFFIVGVGNLVHGTLAAALLAALILWHRIDVSAPKWIQLKDALGLLFVFFAGVAPEPFQNFSICMGSLFLALSFGFGGLGVIPALLILRQYVPHPAEFEILMGVAGLYWVTVEILRHTKFEQKAFFSSILEALCSLGILYGLKDILLKWVDDPILLAMGGALFVLAILLATLVHFKGEAFWTFYRKFKNQVEASLTFGNRLISSDIPWPIEPREKGFLAVEDSFNRLFVLTLTILGLLGVMFVISRGGFI